MNDSWPIIVPYLIPFHLDRESTQSSSTLTDQKHIILQEDISENYSLHFDDCNVSIVCNYENPRFTMAKGKNVLPSSWSWRRWRWVQL